MRALAAGLLGLTLSLPAAAQNTTGEISGLVRDATPGVVPGATVTLSYPQIAEPQRIFQFGAKVLFQ